MNYNGSTQNSYFRRKEDRMSAGEFRRYLAEGMLHGRTNYTNEKSYDDSSDSDNTKSQTGKVIQTIFAFFLVVGLIAVFVTALVPSLKAYSVYFLLGWAIYLCLVILMFPGESLNSVARRNTRFGFGVGLVALIGVAIAVIINKSGEFEFTPSFWFMLGGILASVLAVICIIAPIINDIILKKRCTSETMATVVGYDDKLMHSKHHTYMVSAAVYSFAFEGKDYLVCDGVYRQDENRLLMIGQTAPVYFDPEEPGVCRFKTGFNGFSVFTFFGVIIMFFAVALFAASGLEMESSGKVLNDKKIEQYYSKELGYVPDYIVYRRTVIGQSGSTLYFHQIGGAMNSIKNPDFSEGDYVYWVQSEDGDVVLYDANQYEYEGAHFCYDTDYFTNKGEFILTDSYLNNYFGTSSFDVYETYVTEVNQTSVNFNDADGNEYRLSYPNKTDLEFSDIEVGDYYYFVVSSNGTDIFNMHLNTYRGNR